MEYCLSRRNKDGMMEGLSGDWVFIDWAEGLSKKGAVSFEQLLLTRSLETMTSVLILLMIQKEQLDTNKLEKN
jgi:hypothetical protein